MGKSRIIRICDQSFLNGSLSRVGVKIYFRDIGFFLCLVLG